MTIYSVSGHKCVRKYKMSARTWVYITLSHWRSMSASERNQFSDHSVIQTQARLSGRFYQ